MACARTTLRTALRELSASWPKPRLSCGAPGEDGRTAADLFADRDWLNRLLAAQTRITPGLDAKAQAAYLASYYATTIATAGAGLLVGYGMVPDLSPDRIVLSIDPARDELAFQDIAVRFPANPVAADGGDMAGAFRQQVEAHFRPLVVALNRITGLPRQALWRLVGDALGSAFLDAGEKLDALDEAAETGLAVLKEPGSPLFNCQLHYFEVSVVRPDDVPATRKVLARGGCCRLYTAPGGALCASCVLQKPGDRERLAGEALRRELVAGGA
ncbi:ferric iron reductase [Pseudohoeflea suaedae]|uniref:Ferric iron reductase n=1 Tax=Pseudohoeflea suaedae TaxID=877384 RepID=A0A4R5PL49_9HYPH|nr:ferric iron reductase [Pseudohoeflea suaedae]TDH37643.1 ferric iron reductase [Pseudohoeflea suaedae]